VLYLIAQLSDTHVGGPHFENGRRLSLAVDAINAMTVQPDLVLVTGDLTHEGSAEQWSEFCDRMNGLRSPWQAIAGNHDRGVAELAGHRTLDAGSLRLVLLDSSRDEFTADDAAWLDSALSECGDRATLIAIHHPPFETGIWWMDCLGLAGMELFETVVRRHTQVVKVLSGHVHRPIQTQWGSCSLWVCPSTAVAIALDLDPQHDPAESAEPPAFSLHAFTGSTFVSYVVPVGAEAERSSIGARAPEFVAEMRALQQQRRRRGPAT